MHWKDAVRPEEGARPLRDVISSGEDFGIIMTKLEERSRSTTQFYPLFQLLTENASSIIEIYENKPKPLIGFLGQVISEAWTVPEFESQIIEPFKKSVKEDGSLARYPRLLDFINCLSFCKKACSGDKEVIKELFPRETSFVGEKCISPETLALEFQELSIEYLQELRNKVITHTQDRSKEVGPSR